MKIKFEKFKRPATILGYFTLDMKYITVEIEYKYYIESNQLNLQPARVQYKVKDKLKRVKHSNDYLKAFAQKFFRKKIKKQINKQLGKIIGPYTDIPDKWLSKQHFINEKEMKVFWKESK